MDACGTCASLVLVGRFGSGCPELVQVSIVGYLSNRRVVMSGAIELESDLSSDPGGQQLLAVISVCVSNEDRIRGRRRRLQGHTLRWPNFTPKASLATLTNKQAWRAWKCLTDRTRLYPSGSSRCRIPHRRKFERTEPDPFRQAWRRVKS